MALRPWLRDWTTNGRSSRFLNIMLGEVVRPARGRVCLLALLYPRSFGLCPPTRGLRQIGPLRGPSALSKCLFKRYPCYFAVTPLYLWG